MPVLYAARGSEPKRVGVRMSADKRLFGFSRFWQGESDRRRWIFVVIAVVALVIRLTPLLRAGDRWAVLDDSHDYLALSKGISPDVALRDGRTLDARRRNYYAHLVILFCLRSCLRTFGGSWRSRRCSVPQFV